MLAHPRSTPDTTLSRLHALSRNLWWSWDPQATELFAGLDPQRWEALDHNPVALLAELGELPSGISKCVDEVYERFQAYLAGSGTWADRALPNLGRVVYLSMEFGIHESLRIYSGGLGVLAGDHLRSASDLGLDFVAVGLFYKHGYFRQVIDLGQQVAAWPTARPELLPLEEVHVAGQPLRVAVPHGDHQYRARVWRVQVGRVPLYLLDADLPENHPEDREVTASLYGGDASRRIRQEVLLGVGGFRVLRALDLPPEVLHLNEGHCAFAPLEWLRQKVETGEQFQASERHVQRHTVFTTHTPVPAGHDRFGWDLVDGALGRWRDQMGWSHGTIMDRGRRDPSNLNSALNMTRLAMGMSRSTNGVSALHGQVSRDMFANPDIGHVTNGVHPAWTSPEVRGLLDRVQPDWVERATEGRALEALEACASQELAESREPARRRLRAFIHQRLGVQVPEGAMLAGFARRFAPYKRADLLLSDAGRLDALLEAGLYVVFAGKAHPHDEAGKALVARVLEACRDPRTRGRVLFLSGYDIHIGRLLTQGVDLWINNPRRPREASGTSGQKVLLNGGLNASVLDGWWPESFAGDNGWAIGEARSYASIEEQDAADARSLYGTLEDVLATWGQERWWDMVRRSMSQGFPAFNTHRMVADYARNVYAGTD